MLQLDEFPTPVNSLGRGSGKTLLEQVVAAAGVNPSAGWPNKQQVNPCDAAAQYLKIETPSPLSGIAKIVSDEIHNLARLMTIDLIEFSVCKGQTKAPGYEMEITAKIEIHLKPHHPHVRRRINDIVEMYLYEKARGLVKLPAFDAVKFNVDSKIEGSVDLAS